MAEIEVGTELAAIRKAQEDQGAALSSLVDGLAGLTGLLGTQTEMLGLILEAATREPAGDNTLGETLTAILAALKRIEDRLPEC